MNNEAEVGRGKNKSYTVLKLTKTTPSLQQIPITVLVKRKGSSVRNREFILKGLSLLLITYYCKRSLTHCYLQPSEHIQFETLCHQD